MLNVLSEPSMPINNCYFKSVATQELNTESVMVFKAPCMFIKEPVFKSVNALSSVRSEITRSPVGLSDANRDHIWL